MKSGPTADQDYAAAFGLRPLLACLRPLWPSSSASASVVSRTYWPFLASVNLIVIVAPVPSGLPCPKGHRFGLRWAESGRWESNHVTSLEGLEQVDNEVALIGGQPSPPACCAITCHGW